jgi:hypothetical protein
MAYSNDPPFACILVARSLESNTDSQSRFSRNARVHVRTCACVCCVYLHVYDSYSAPSQFTYCCAAEAAARGHFSPADFFFPRISFREKFSPADFAAVLLPSSICRGNRLFSFDHLRSTCVLISQRYVAAPGGKRVPMEVFSAIARTRSREYFSSLSAMAYFFSGRDLEI